MSRHPRGFIHYTKNIFSFLLIPVLILSFDVDCLTFPFFSRHCLGPEYGIIFDATSDVADTCDTNKCTVTYSLI